MPKGGLRNVCGIDFTSGLIKGRWVREKGCEVGPIRLWGSARTGQAARRRGCGQPVRRRATMGGLENPDNSSVERRLGRSSPPRATKARGG